MLLLKRCSISSRKKKKSLLLVSIFQKRSWKIYENWEESGKSYSESWKSVSQSERLWTHFRRTGCAAWIAPCCWKRCLSFTPHIILTRKKNPSFLLDKWAQPALQQISRREDIFKRYPSHGLHLLAEPIPFYRNAHWGWKIESKEISDWIQDTRY